MTDHTSKITLDGHLERITYHNAESHFTIAKLRTGKQEHLVSILGVLPNPSLGEALSITGSWEIHARYGEQFRFESFEVMLPATVDGIRKYLESGFVKGIGPKTAARMVARFGEKTLEVIEKQPQRLVEVKGIGKSTAEQIASAWSTYQVIRGLIQFLQEYGIKASYSATLYRTYGQDAIDIIREAPYRLATDLPGIGFQIADAIARKTGLPADDPERVQACVLNQLRRSSDEGHVCLPMDHLIRVCAEKFDIYEDDARVALSGLSDDGEVIIVEDYEGAGDQAVYLQPLFQAEDGISIKISALLSVPVATSDVDSAAMTAAVLKKFAIQLSEEQLQVLNGILSHRIAIVTGGPGTGKTTLIRSITSIFGMLGKQILLAAPTGRAARRLSEITGKKAETIHKLLGYNPKDGSFEKNRDNPLPADGVIIDEASMVDTLLMFHLMNAVHLESHLIFVGDVFQLPSVGPGNVLSDLMRSERIKTYELTDVFRQAQESAIIVNAHKVRQGESPDIADTGSALSEFCFIEHQRSESVVKTIVDLCGKKLPSRYDLDPVRDIQVLTPMHRGVAGTINLNLVLQNALNPNPVTLKVFETTFKTGDKVMHLKNNYVKEVFNGDIGTIESIDNAKESVTIDYDGRHVSYDFTELDEIALAYAISVHKSQGSEYPAVIIPLVTQHFPLLQRNLLYTAITRGKEYVFLIGSKKALHIALGNDKPQRRMSGLAHRLSVNEIGYNDYSPSSTIIF